MPHEDVSLKVLSEEVCETLADAAKLKDVSLEVTGDDSVINGVRRLLYEVVYNLCDNAIKYNNPGGRVKVSVAEQQELLRLASAIPASVLLPSTRTRYLNVSIVWIRAIPSSPVAPVWVCPSSNTLFSIITARSLWKAN